jgi:NADPH-dependent 2,4-dienoyl-CoA reductase/sulfur reductase-like enzyme
MRSWGLLRSLRNYTTGVSEMKCCVVGSGPGGFYAAEYLLSEMKEKEMKIDVYEKLPFPFGLVRYGVGGLLICLFIASQYPSY